MAPPPTPSSPSASLPLPALLDRVRSGDNGDGALFALLAALAREAGRDDVHSEFTRRAVAPAVPGAPAPLAPQPTASPGHYPAPEPGAKAHADRGAGLLRDGRLADAEGAFREAVRLDPRHAPAHGNLGVALARQGKLADAQAAFRLALRLDPADPAWYANLANACVERGAPADAEPWAREGLLLNPRSADLHQLLGAALEARGDRDGAVAAYREAVRLDPGRAEVHARLGKLLARAGRAGEAEAALRQAVRARPGLAAAWVGLGVLLEREGKAAEAEGCCREAVRLAPDSAEAYHALGVALASLDRPAEAEAAYRAVTRLRPKFVPARINLGNALRAQGRLAEAEAVLRDVLAERPGAPEGQLNLGLALLQQGLEDEGLRHLDEAVRLRPGYPEARVNRALTLMARGDFDRAWLDYAWRWKLRGMKHSDCPAPRWDGSPLGGKTLLVLAEQGLGDLLQLVRYAPLVKARGGVVVVEAPAVLAELLATCPGVDQVVQRGRLLPAADACLPLFDLMALFGVPPAAPAAVPYLQPPADRVAYWRRELAGVGGLRVGFVWQGSKGHKGDRERSVPLARFARLAGVPGVRLLSLQKGPEAKGLAGVEGVEDLGGRTRAGMEDAAAAVANLDLVVAVDTAVAHLAGGLGVPVWVAVPFLADWRWGRAREDTPWYPTMRLFRQPAPGDWDSVFARLGAVLADAARAKAQGRWPGDSRPLAAAA